MEDRSCYLCLALAYYDLGAAYHEKAYLYTCGYEDPTQGLEYYEDARNSYMQCDDSAKQQLQLLGSAFLEELGRDQCANFSNCISRCLEKVQEGEDACHADECANRCPQKPGPTP